MRKFHLLSFLLLFLCSLVKLNAQYSGAGGMGRGGFGKSTNLNIGHFYGKIVDAKNKGIGGVTVQLFINKFDTVTHQLKIVVNKTDITENNGDFDLDGLSLMGRYQLKISSVGYKKIEMPVTFGIKRPEPGTTPDFQKMASQADKDLGNIKLEQDAATLDAVTVTSVKPMMELGIDRKVFNVDKNLSSTGQTATEIMKSIPSLSVDIDGNVTLRNATPTLFVDGRPTTLTLDQIPSDIIEKVEIITNPSAKYDASGGGTGILNIILKKNKKNGYNGNVRAGVDARGKVNGGGDINYRENKINLSASANYNQRKSITTTTSATDYLAKGSSPEMNVNANNDGTNNGHFQFYRLGLDYFIDIRNTLSAAGSYTQGAFNNYSNQGIDSSYTSSLISNTTRITDANFHFENFGGQLSFKHNFAKDGHNITADANYNSSNNGSSTDINSLSYSAPGVRKYHNPYLQQTLGNGYNHYTTIQSDYENPLSDDSKFEAGIRLAIRDFKTDNEQFTGDSVTQPVISPKATSVYKYTDQVYAAYGTYSFKTKRFGFQLGLRAESSDYHGNMTKPNDTTFKVSYPISLFPSVYITYKLTESQSFQLNYSRKINRPNFFQILPAYNFTDPQNPSVGNPGLKPEFANALEWSYNNNYNRTDNFLATAYFKYSTNLITNYIFKDINRNTQTFTTTSDSLYYSSYTNANYSYTYGLELTEKMNLAKWWDLLLNVNFYDSKLNATIPSANINNDLISWFSKVNSTFKFGKGFSFQFTWESRSKTLIPQRNDGGGGGRSGGMFGGGPQTLAQGYTLPRYWDVDAAIRKDWTMSRGRGASLTLGINDIFRTGNRTYSDASFYTQNSLRLRDPQMMRLNFSYRFGKIDVSLFKRKNTKAEQGGGLENMGGGN